MGLFLTLSMRISVIWGEKSVCGIFEFFKDMC